jgi:hypothetical protein
MTSKCLIHNRGRGGSRSQGGGGEGGSQSQSRAGWWLETPMKTKSLMEMFEDADQIPLYFNDTDMGNGDGSRSGLSGGSVTLKKEETKDGGEAPTVPKESESRCSSDDNIG